MNYKGWKGARVGVEWVWCWVVPVGGAEAVGGAVGGGVKNRSKTEMGCWFYFHTPQLLS